MGGIEINNNQTYYSQKDIINEVRGETGFSAYTVERVFNALEFIIQEKLGDENSHVEITIFPGLKVYAKPVRVRTDGIHKDIPIQSKQWTRISAKFTDAFKAKLRKT